MKSLAEMHNRSEIWKKTNELQLILRLKDMISRLLDGFDGKLTSSKWAMLEKCSQDTAGRDIAGLLEGILLQKSPESGRSTSYTLKM